MVLKWLYVFAGFCFAGYSLEDIGKLFGFTDGKTVWWCLDVDFGNPLACRDVEMFDDGGKFCSVVIREGCFLNTAGEDFCTFHDLVLSTGSRKSTSSVLPE